MGCITISTVFSPKPSPQALSPYPPSWGKCLLPTPLILALMIRLSWANGMGAEVTDATSKQNL